MVQNGKFFVFKMVSFVVYHINPLLYTILILITRRFVHYIDFLIENSILFRKRRYDKVMSTHSFRRQKGRKLRQNCSRFKRCICSKYSVNSESLLHIFHCETFFFQRVIPSRQFLCSPYLPSWSCRDLTSTFNNSYIYKEQSCANSNLPQAFFWIHPKEKNDTFAT